MNDAERALFAAEFTRMQPWYSLMYKLNCRIPNAWREGRFADAISMIRYLRFIHPPFADIETQAIFRKLDL